MHSLQEAQLKTELEYPMWTSSLPSKSIAIPHSRLQSLVNGPLNMVESPFGTVQSLLEHQLGFVRGNLRGEFAIHRLHPANSYFFQ